MLERIVTYQCFAFPGMRKGVENGFKTPDMKTLRVLQPRNYTIQADFRQVIVGKLFVHSTSAN